MAAVFDTTRRQIGSVKPTKSGAVAAWSGRKRLELFVTTDLAIAAIKDCAQPALKVEGYLALVEAIVEEGE